MRKAEKTIAKRIYCNQGCGSGPFSAGSDKSQFGQPDPDPTGTHQESIQTSTFFYINQISSDIFMLIFLPEKFKNSSENV